MLMSCFILFVCFHVFVFMFWCLCARSQCHCTGQLLCWVAIFHQLAWQLSRPAPLHPSVFPFVPKSFSTPLLLFSTKPFFFTPKLSSKCLSLQDSQPSFGSYSYLLFFYCLVCTSYPSSFFSFVLFIACMCYVWCFAYCKFQPRLPSSFQFSFEVFLDICHELCHKRACMPINMFCFGPFMLRFAM